MLITQKPDADDTLKTLMISKHLEKLATIRTVDYN